MNRCPNLYVLRVFFVGILLITSAVFAGEDPLWQDVGLYGGQIVSLAVDPADNATLYAGGYGGDGLFKTTDRGKTWVTIPGFRNTIIFDIAIDPNNSANVWIVTNQYIGFSDDYGQTWKQFIVHGLTGYRLYFTVAVDPHDPSGNTVYVGTSGTGASIRLGAVFKTTDGGATWSKVKNYTRYGIIDITVNLHTAGEIWALSAPWAGAIDDAGVYVSQNSGATWYEYTSAQWPDGSINSFRYLDELELHPEDPLHIFACGNFGIFHKADGTARTDWQKTTLPESFFSCRALTMPPREPDTLYAFVLEDTGEENATTALRIAKSADVGQTWDEVYDAPGELMLLEADPDKPERLYAGGVNHGVFTTEDGARTWHSINNGIRANTIFDTALFDKDPTKKLCGTISGVYKTDDGREWQHINTQYIAYAVAFHPEDENIIYTGHDYVMGKSTDSGSTWRYLKPSPDTDLFRITSIALSTDNPDTVFAGLAYGSGQKGVLVKLLDDRDDFEITVPETILSTSVPVNAVTIHPADSKTVYAGTGNFYAPVVPGRVYVSRDTGSTWAETGLQDVVVNSIAISPTDPDIVYAGCGGSDTRYSGIYKSVDGGIGWQYASRGLPYYAAVSEISVDGQSSDVVYASLAVAYTRDLNPLGGVFVSLDGAGYLTQVGLSDYILYAMNSFVPASVSADKEKPSKKSRISLPSSTLLAGTASGLFSSTTAGSGVISGSIMHAETGELIDGATVSTTIGANSVSSEGYYLLLVPAGVHTLQVTYPGYIQTAPPTVTVAAGTTVQQDCILQPTGSDNGTCLAEALLDRPQHKDVLCSLRVFRDRVLSRSGPGQYVIKQYYILGDDIVQVLTTYPELKTRCRDLLLKSLPLVEALLAEKKMQSSQTVKQGLTNLLKDLERASPAGLAKQLHSLRNRLASEQF